MTEERKKIYKTECEIEVALTRLIGPLAIMAELKSYNGIRKELLELLSIIVKWGATFQINRNLDFIKEEELINIQDRIEHIKDEYLYRPDIGVESELSDEIVIWMCETMILNKKLKEMKGNFYNE